jgi:hypothetical protein
MNNRVKRFIIDGEAVVLGVDGVADFNALHMPTEEEELKLSSRWSIMHADQLSLLRRRARA